MAGGSASPLPYYADHSKLSKAVLHQARLTAFMLYQNERLSSNCSTYSMPPKVFVFNINKL